jgi:hypothetical protein
MHCRTNVLPLLQHSPSQGSTLDACAHVETLLTHVLQQQLTDYRIERFCGSRAMQK